jgi:hypothetical protein
MTQPRIKPAIGAIDGVNKTFKTEQPFAAGTVIPFINGKAEFGRMDTEFPPKTFTLDIAPLATDNVGVYYREG